MTTTEFPELTPEQKAYDINWDDPDWARRQRIEALAHIVDGLWGWSSTPGIDDDDDDDGSLGIYYKAERRATCSLVWDLAWAGALDGAVHFDECGELVQTISRLDTSGPDPMLITVYRDGQRSGDLLADFTGNLIESYVGLPGTKMYGGDAIVELARDWLARTESVASTPS